MLNVNSSPFFKIIGEAAHEILDFILVLRSIGFYLGILEIHLD